MSQGVIIKPDENGNLPLFRLADAAGANQAVIANYGNADTTAPTLNALLVAAEQIIFDQQTSTYVRQRSNANIAVLASAARTATPVQTSITNYNWKNLLLIVKVTVVGTLGITPVISVNVPGAGDVVLLTGTQITTTGTYVYAIGTDAPAVAGAITASLKMGLPKTLKYDFTHADASSWTYSVDAAYSL